MEAISALDKTNSVPDVSYVLTTDGQLRITGIQKNTMVTIYNSNGCELYKTNLVTDASINMTQFPHAIYLIKVEQDNKYSVYKVCTLP